MCSNLVRSLLMPARYQLLQDQAENKEYTTDNSRDLAKIVCHANYRLIQTYSLKADIKMFGKSGRKAVLDQMEQIHDRVLFCPIYVDKMSEIERKQAIQSLMFVVQKRCGQISANGITQCWYITKDEAASQTVKHEESKTKSSMLTAEILMHLSKPTLISLEKRLLWR